ncbi:hypothetical protein [Bradyrhizobium sp. G127]|uniref:hypothetical protein n=1 Tax=Bradyrhizobium sp. G127 TaxID=2904800 RepID=UPI001F239BA4|nr:hypothetical protein [Bradyrhizobium sp. G127]MCF2525405.1 hypothetical protein [Bradyrhizobium sp. G127]
MMLKVENLSPRDAFRLAYRLQRINQAYGDLRTERIDLYPPFWPNYSALLGTELEKKAEIAWQAEHLYCIEANPNFRSQMFAFMKEDGEIETVSPPRKTVADFNELFPNDPFKYIR